MANPTLAASPSSIDRRCKRCGYSIADHSGTFLICPHTDYQQFEADPEPPIDPVEYAAHSILDSLAAIEKELVTTQDLDRAWVLKGHTKRLYEAIVRIDSKALDTIDAIVERRR